MPTKTEYAFATIDILKGVASLVRGSPCQEVLDVGLAMITTCEVSLP